jgi:hypothetical protein
MIGKKSEICPMMNARNKPKLKKVNTFSSLKVNNKND